MAELDASRNVENGAVKVRPRLTMRDQFRGVNCRVARRAVALILSGDHRGKYPHLAGTQSCPPMQHERKFGFPEVKIIIRNMTHTPSKNSLIQWQECPEDEIAEPALLIEAYPQIIMVRQAGESIAINLGSIDELVKNLRYFQRVQK